MEAYQRKFTEAESPEDKVIEFFKKNPKPKDKEIHTLADELKIDIHKFEEVIYNLLGSFFGEGLSKDFKGEYDPKELEMGIKIEMEHTSNKTIAEKIAKDHLAESSKYYTALSEMEKELEKE